MSVPYKFRLLVISLFFFCLSSAVITYIGVKTLSGSAIMAFSERGIAAVYKANSAVDAEQFIQLADFGTESHPYYKILYDKLSSNIVEVKTRATNIVNAASVISESKVRNIINAGKAYLRLYNISQISMQIDIIYVIGQPDNFRIVHIENAVQPHNRSVRPRRH